MINFRPHRISYLQVADGYKDENGDWIAGTSEYVGSIECRAEPNGKAMRIALPDGQAFVYSYVVYLNRDCREFKLNEGVRIIDQHGSILCEKSCNGFHRGQLTAKLWV